MKSFFKENWKFILFVVLSGLIGGYFVASYQYSNLTDDLLNQVQNQLETYHMSKNVYLIISAIQIGILYGLLLSIIGIILSKKVGLWSKFKIDKKDIILTLIISIIGGLILYPGDKILFGSIEMVRESYLTKPTISFFIGSILYGGVIEEVMMRLTLMSLVAFIIYKIFYKKEKEVPAKAFIISNIIAALLFALGHLPSTMTMTTLTPLIVIRCMVMNGAYGLAFGYLYRKYGIHYSILCHGLCHFISKILMFIFI